MCSIPKWWIPYYCFLQFVYCSIVLDTFSNPGNFENGDVRNHEKTPFQASHMYQTGTSVASVFRDQSIPCHSKTSGVDPPGGHLPDSGETPTAQLLLPHATRDFPGTKPMVVGCQLFWGGYSSPVNWKLVQTQQSTNFERFQKTKDQEQNQSPTEYPQPTHRLELLGYRNQKKSWVDRNKWLFRPFKLIVWLTACHSACHLQRHRNSVGPTHHSPPELGGVFRIGPPHFPSSVVPFCGKAVGPWRVPMYSTGTSEK